MYTYLLKMQAAFWGGEEVADPRVCSSSRSKGRRAHSTVARHILFKQSLIFPTTLWHCWTFYVTLYSDLEEYRHNLNC